MKKKLVANNPKYWEFIRKLRNTNEGMAIKTHITEEQQIKYMEARNNDYYVCLLGSEPVGYIGVVDNDLRIFVDKKHRRKGIGTFMLRELPRVTNNIQIRVLAENFSSQEFFEKNGFKKTFIYYE